MFENIQYVLLIHLHTAKASNILVPLQADNFGLGSLVPLGVSGLTGPRMAVLTFAPSSFITTGNGDPATNPIFTIGDDLVQFEETNTRFVRYSLGRSRLAIGPRSELFRAHGPIAVLNNSFLVLNSTESHFHQNCLPDSLITIPYTNQSSSIAIEGQINFDEWFQVFLSPRWILLDHMDDGSILKIPGPLHWELHHILITAGFVEVSDSDFVFTNCGNKQAAPVIQFLIPGVDSEISTLALYPEDYLRDYPNTDRCKLLIGINRGSGAVWNLLQMPGINIRLSNDTRSSNLQVCDTNL